MTEGLSSPKKPDIWFLFSYRNRGSFPKNDIALNVHSCKIVISIGGYDEAWLKMERIPPGVKERACMSKVDS